MITVRNQTGVKLYIKVSRDGKNLHELHLWLFTEKSRPEVGDVIDPIIDEHLLPSEFIKTSLVNDCELCIHLKPESLSLRDEVYADGSHIMTAYFVQ